MSALHAVIAGSNIGILVLATGAFFVRLAMWNSDNKYASLADKVAYISAAVGVSLAVLSGISGYFFTWAPEAIRTTLLTQNKILVTIALLLSWTMFLVLRRMAGEGLWASTPLKIWAAILVAFGFVNTVLVGSMGGSASLIGTILDPALISFNINRYISLSWGVGLSIAMIVAALGFLAFSFTRRQNN